MSFLLKIKELLRKNETIKYYLKDFRIHQLKRNYDKVSDEDFLKQQFKFNFGRDLDLENPRTLNEKLQWYKLYYHNPILHKLVDKHEVRDYIKKSIGEQYLIKELGIYNSVEEINFDELPNSFVVKLSNGSGCNYVCKNKTEKEIKKIKKLFTRWIKTEYYYYSREFAYKGVKNRIIIEEFMCSDKGEVPEDYKLYCFNGEVDSVMVCSGRGDGDTKFYYYDNKWNMLPYSKDGKEVLDKHLPNPVKKPKKLDEMFSVANKLSKDFPFVRVDLYYVNNNIYFGEMTFTPGAGMDRDKLPEVDLYMGEKFKLEKYE